MLPLLLVGFEKMTRAKKAGKTRRLLQRNLLSCGTGKILIDFRTKTSTRLSAAALHALHALPNDITVTTNGGLRGIRYPFTINTAVRGLSDALRR